MLFSVFFSSLFSALKNTSITEWFIFITALVYVIFAAYENVWCWSLGIISSALSIYLCYTGKLFIESALQVFYVIIGFYGWYQWLYGSEQKSEIHIVKYQLKKIVPLFLIGLLFFIPLGFIAHCYSTQAMPYLDAFITAFSLIATWMTAKKILENWLFWIVVDALAIVLYGYRHFYLIALLYLIYTVLASAGYFVWRKKIA